MSISSASARSRDPPTTDHAWQHQSQQDIYSEEDAEEPVDEEAEENEDEEEVDQLVDEDEDAENPEETTEEDSSGGDKDSSSGGGRIPGQTLLPTVRLENIMQADGVTGSLSLSREGMFILSVATEEFIRRLAQGGHREATTEGRNTIQYHDMANTTRQYQEFMFLQDIIPAPMSLSDALELREAREREAFDEDPSQAKSMSTTSGRGLNPNSALRPSMSSSSHTTNPKPKKSRSTNGKEKEKATGSAPSSRSTSAVTHSHSNAPTPSVSVGPGVAPSSTRGSQWVPGHGMLDARPWTHWTEPQTGPGGTFVNSRSPEASNRSVIVNGSSAPGYPTPNSPTTINGHPDPAPSASPSRSRTGTAAAGTTPASTSVPPTSSASPSASKDSRPGSGSPVESISDHPTSSQFTGPASGYLQGPGGPSPFSRSGTNHGRTIYSQQG
ncbi:hypothetical protein K435DRAFT_745693 [Dendrothele bispora CBS 962.96]|uniref:Transcription factor CBF/NF-Y/archaeal histone domain-containing protein n=1 Tax=Dendrothele bispora (strain CBS 962.96) TaxID=1314807 RepID=A0A4V4HI56_DENBC|nr:hypothetical protein K435DRAFT_745693 [Dendrothele bispora CBS 962.96]